MLNKDKWYTTKVSAQGKEEKERADQQKGQLIRNHELKLRKHRDPR